MVKTTKKSAANHGKPITSFFARTSKPSPSTFQDAPSSSVKTILDNKSPFNKSKPDASPVPTSALRSPEKTPETATKYSAPRERRGSVSSLNAEKHSPSLAPLAPSTSLPSLKRSRLPDIQSESKRSTARTRSESLKSENHRKGKFDSDSDVEQSSATVFVTSTPSTQRRKKARLSPPEDEISLPIIPSSQSEEELVYNPPDPLTPKAMTQDYRRQAFVTPDGDKRIDMTVDVADDGANSTNSGPLLPDRSSQWSLKSGDQMLTPPPSDLPSLPPTPQVLDAATKTAQIIADIKAKAYANIDSSPEPSLIEFNEKLDSSSDEDDMLPLTALKREKATNPSAISVEPTRRSTRYSLRNKSPFSPSKGSRQKTSIRRHAEAETSPYRQSTQSKKKNTATNPFTALLREKREAERRGDRDAFRKADFIANNIGKRSQEEDLDMDTDEDIIDWDAAAQTARTMPWFVGNTSSPNNAGPSNLNQTAGDEEQRAYSGAKKGKGQIVMDILEKDKISQQERESSQIVKGLRIWARSTADDDRDKNRMVTDEDAPCYQLPGNSAGVCLLNSCLRCHDTIQASMLLDMDILSSVPDFERSGLASSLYNIALSPRCDALGESATHALERFWSSNSDNCKSTIHFDQILEIFNHLGMEASLLTFQKWVVRAPHHSLNVELEQRENIIRRLISLVSACASSKRLEVAEIPNLIMGLLLLGMNSEASSEVVEDVTRAIDLICHCLSGENHDIESDLCQKILYCVQPYTPINKARMIALLSAGSGVTHRIAVIVCYNVITQNNGDDKAVLSELPPITNIVDQLISYSGRPGKFTIDRDTDYDDLGFYTFILGVAVSNIRGYVLQELASKSRTSSLWRPASPAKSAEKQSSIQTLIDVLENLHNKISDTRAAHLERSRAKAILKGLSMTLHYQQRFWQRNDAEVRTKTLVQYFKKKDK